MKKVKTQPGKWIVNKSTHICPQFQGSYDSRNKYLERAFPHYFCKEEVSPSNITTKKFLNLLRK
jgi:hypothetical protein